MAFLIVCKLQSKAQAVLVDPVLKKIWTARGSWQTTSIPCVGGWMKTRLAEMEINKDRIKVRMQDRIQDRMKARSRDRGSQVNKVNRVVSNRAVRTRDSNKVVNSRDSSRDSNRVLSNAD